MRLEEKGLASAHAEPPCPAGYLGSPACIKPFKQPASSSIHTEQSVCPPWPSILGQKCFMFLQILEYSCILTWGCDPGLNTKFTCDFHALFIYIHMYTIILYHVFGLQPIT